MMSSGHEVDGILTHAVAKALRDVPDVCKAIDTSMLTLAFDSPAGLRRSNIKNLGAKSVLDVANLLKVCISKCQSKVYALFSCCLCRSCRAVALPRPCRQIHPPSRMYFVI